MNWEKLASAALTLAALAFAGILIRREFFAPKTRVTVIEGEDSRFEPQWGTIVNAGRRLGPASAPVTIIEYSDFECPYCGQFNSTINALRKRFGSDLNYVFIHWPLNIHRFARPAAITAECAANQIRFEAIADVLFAKKDSFGLKSWASYAADAGVADTISFAKCTREASAAQLIDRGVNSAREMKVRFTPTVILNGWRYGSTPSEAELTRAIELLIAGRKPYPNFPEAALSVGKR